jgi:hypothetical protein
MEATMANEDYWKDLTDPEKTSCDELNGHRAISDWPGYTSEQSQRAKGAKAWLSDRLEEIKDLISESSNEENHQQHRYNRRDYIKAVVDADERTIHNLGPNYPSGHATENEDVYIEEREYYLGWSSQYEAQKERKLANLSWLEERRKYVWNCAEGNVDDVEPGWNISHREERYDNLQIATHYGSAWDEWQEENSGGGGSSGGNWRDKSASWHEHHLGLTESPADSNCDSRSDGIRTSQDGCANGTWLRYQPWCGCWAWSGLYAAGKVKKGDSWLASVASIEDYAKAGRGPFKGWTTDGSKAKKGDLVVLFGRGQHVGTIRSTDANYAYTWEGNTSSGSSGSQSNGGGSYKRSRSRSSETYGYALVKD